MARWRGRGPAVEVMRSRPYCRNDNTHAEQKNRTHVRELLGEDRIALLACHSALNPLQLHRRIETLLGAIWALQNGEDPAAACEKAGPVAEHLNPT